MPPATLTLTFLILAFLPSLGLASRETPEDPCKMTLQMRAKFQSVTPVLDKMTAHHLLLRLRSSPNKIQGFGIFRKNAGIEPMQVYSLFVAQFPEHQRPWIRKNISVVLLKDNGVVKSAGLWYKGSSVAPNLITAIHSYDNMYLDDNTRIAVSERRGTIVQLKPSFYKSLDHILSYEGESFETLEVAETVFETASESPGAYARKMISRLRNELTQAGIPGFRIRTTHFGLTSWRAVNPVFEIRFGIQRDPNTGQFYYMGQEVLLNAWQLQVVNRLFDSPHGSISQESVQQIIDDFIRSTGFPASQSFRYRAKTLNEKFREAGASRTMIINSPSSESLQFAEVKRSETSGISQPISDSQNVPYATEVVVDKNGIVTLDGSYINLGSVPAEALAAMMKNITPMSSEQIHSSLSALGIGNLPRHPTRLGQIIQRRISEVVGEELVKSYFPGKNTPALYYADLDYSSEIVRGEQLGPLIFTEDGMVYLSGRIFPLKEVEKSFLRMVVFSDNPVKGSDLVQQLNDKYDRDINAAHTLASPINELANRLGFEGNLLEFTSSSPYGTFYYANLPRAPEFMARLKWRGKLAMSQGDHPFFVFEDKALRLNPVEATLVNILFIEQVPVANSRLTTMLNSLGFEVKILSDVMETLKKKLVQNGLGSLIQSIGNPRTASTFINPELAEITLPLERLGAFQRVVGTQALLHDGTFLDLSAKYMKVFLAISASPEGIGESKMAEIFEVEEISQKEVSTIAKINQAIKRQTGLLPIKTNRSVNGARRWSINE